MTVQEYDNFLAGQIEDLKEYISPAPGFYWPLIAQAAKEAKYAITSFVESELQRQVSTHTTIEETLDMTGGGGGSLTTNNTNVKQIDLAEGSGYDRPFSRCSLRTVKLSLYKLARLIRFEGFNTYSQLTVGDIGTWNRDDFEGALCLLSSPYREYNGQLPVWWDQWLISLRYWLITFITGLHFSTSSNAGSSTPTVFSPADQVAALTNGELDSFIPNSQNSGTLWSEKVKNATILMTLPQSLVTLLELPELRMGILCANYLNNLEGLLHDVIDYNIDLIGESNDSITHYVRGKMRLIAEFTSQELETLNSLPIVQIACNLTSHISLTTPLNSSYRYFSVPYKLREAISRIPGE